MISRAYLTVTCNTPEIHNTTTKDEVYCPSNHPWPLRQIRCWSLRCRINFKCSQYQPLFSRLRHENFRLETKGAFRKLQNTWWWILQIFSDHIWLPKFVSLGIFTLILILFYRPVSPFVCRQTSSSTSTQLHLFLDQGRSFYVLAEVFQQVKAKLAAEVCVVRNLGPVREEVSDLDSKEDRLLCTVVYLNLLASQWKATLS